MESDSETFNSLPGSGRKLRVPIKVKRGKVVSPTGVQSFDYYDDGCPDDEQMALHLNPSYMSEQGEETVLLEGDETQEELEARRIRKQMEEDEATHFTEGLGEEIILPEDSDDEEVNEMFDDLEGTFDPTDNPIGAMEAVEEEEEEKKEEDPSDLELAKASDDVDVPKDSSDDDASPEDEKIEDDGQQLAVSEEATGPEAAETDEKKDTDEKDQVDEDDAETQLLATIDTEKPEQQDADEPKPEESEMDPIDKKDAEGKDLACSTNTTEETQDLDDLEQADDSEPKVVEQEADASSVDDVPDDELQTDTEATRTFISRRDSDDDDESSASGRNQLIFAPAVGDASDTDYVTASDTDYDTARDYATTDYGTETDYGTTDVATSFDYDTETSREVDDGVSVNQSVTHSVAHSVANSIAADNKGPRTRKNEKERSKWSLFGCGIVEEVPSTKQEWWNFVLDSTEGALKTVGGNHWDDPWHEEGESFDDDYDAYLNRNRSNRPRRRTRSVSTGRAGVRRMSGSRNRRFRRAASAPRARATSRPKEDRRKMMV